MPMRAARACTKPGCKELVRGKGSRCDAHPPEWTQRPSAAQRGYGPEWKQIRASVLRANHIPQADWPKWDVDHSPRYDRAKQPDHRKYTLTPRLHGDHSRKTNAEDGGGWRRREPEHGR